MVRARLAVTGTGGLSLRIDPRHALDLEVSDGTVRAVWAVGDVRHELGRARADRRGRARAAGPAVAGARVLHRPRTRPRGRRGRAGRRVHRARRGRRPVPLHRGRRRDDRPDGRRRQQLRQRAGPVLLATSARTTRRWSAAGAADPQPWASMTATVPETTSVGPVPATARAAPAGRRRPPLPRTRCTRRCPATGRCELDLLGARRRPVRRSWCGSTAAPGCPATAGCCRRDPRARASCSTSCSTPAWRSRRSSTGTPARRAFPAQLHDAKAAVRWLRHHADELGSRRRPGRDRGGVGRWAPRRAGRAHRRPARPGGRRRRARARPAPWPPSSTGTACPRRETMPEFELPPEVAAVLPPEALVPPLDVLLDGADAATRAAVSPVAHVRAGAPPFLLVHGTADTVVPYAQSELLAEALRARRRRRPAGAGARRGARLRRLPRCRRGRPPLRRLPRRRPGRSAAPLTGAPATP